MTLLIPVTYATLDLSLIRRSEITPNKYMRHPTPLHIIDLSLWRPGYDYSMIQCRTICAVYLHKMNAYIKLDLNPYDVTLE